MRKFFKYLLILFTIGYYLIIYIPGWYTFDGGFFMFLLVGIILFPFISFPIYAFWKIYEDWDKPNIGASPYRCF